LQNIAGIETSGIDLNLDLTTAESGVGRFRFQWMTSFLLDYDDLITNSTGGTTTIAREGTELGSPSRGFVETKSTLNNDWFMNDWFVRLAFRYQSSLTEQCVGLVADFEQTQLCSNGPDTNKLGGRRRTSIKAAGRSLLASTTCSTRNPRSASPATSTAWMEHFMPSPASFGTCGPYLKCSFGLPVRRSAHDKQQRRSPRNGAFSLTRGEQIILLNITQSGGVAVLVKSTGPIFAHQP